MKKRQYRIHNWSDYNAALVDRGRITLWFDEESTDSWFALGTTGKRGLECPHFNRHFSMNSRHHFKLPRRHISYTTM